MLIDSRIQLIGALLQYTGASAIFEEQVQHCHLKKKRKNHGFWTGKLEIPWNGMTKNYMVSLVRYKQTTDLRDINNAF